MSQAPRLGNDNHILRALRDEEYARLLPHLQLVPLTLGETLHMPEQIIEYVYFPTTGLVSLLATLEGGETVETGVVGNEGMVGIPVVLGVDTSTSLSLVQGEGEAVRVRSSPLRSSTKNGGVLQDLMLRFTHAMFTQIAQTAACNRVHSLNQRLARWLLLSHDRLKRDRFALTHEFLARMLGTRRAGVSVAASILREAELIDYTRGQVTILDRKGLEAASCECYSQVRAEYDRLLRD